MDWQFSWPPRAETREAGNAKARAQADAKRKSEEAGQQRLATVAPDAELSASVRNRATTAGLRGAGKLSARVRKPSNTLATLSVAANAEAEAKRKSEEADNERRCLRAEEKEEQIRAEAEARARYSH